jgi:hypothetical protein
VKTYKYLNAEVVAVIDEDGASRMSMLASALPPGTVIEPADPPPPPDTAALRRAAYAAEADPIFFLAQRGEATQAEWLAKIAEIRARYPMPEAA